MGLGVRPKGRDPNRMHLKKCTYVSPSSQFIDKPFGYLFLTRFLYYVYMLYSLLDGKRLLLYSHTTT